LSDADELLPVVDDNDVVQGVRRRGDIHALGLPHRAVHVLVFDGRDRLYLQLRSNSKDTHPNKWTTSASGHVDPDEDYAQAASRELREELGLELALEEVGAIAACQRTENEFTRVYRAVTSQEPRPNPMEITEGRWFELAEARDLAQDLKQASPSLGAVLELI
jgi:isopentenyl-diphosphate delta-isomerase type 1